VGDAEKLAEFALDNDQLDDLAWLLAKHRSLGDLLRFGEKFLDPNALSDAGNDVSNLDAFAHKIIHAMDKDVVPVAIDMLLTESHPSGPMALGLRHILSGERLNSDDALQALITEHEPFLSSADMIELLPKVARRVCAVALGIPYKKIMGSGFLIAQDVVITNYHVIEPFLPKNQQTGEFEPKEPGSKIFFLFDYLRAPKPNIPPPATVRGTICVTAAENWYVYGREKLRDDGKPNCPKEVKNNELDYVLIRLAKPVGALSFRTGGGAIRGWLSLEEEIETDDPGKRILVVQHPEERPQLFDIGDYIEMDPSKTRVRYSVNTAKGSSGGAAIGTDGRLFALHNAEVENNAPNALAAPRRVNQGVRIDLITKDIGPKLPKPPVPSEDKKLLWSLNDDFQNSRPIIGRIKFRDHFTQMTVTNAERALVVTGTPPAGLNFSIKMLHRMRLPDVRVAEFSVTDLQKPITEGFLPTLVSALNIGGRAGNMPDPFKTETETRWVGDVTKWLLNALAKDQELDKTKYPAWIVMNTVMPDQKAFVWPAYLEDVIATLLGRRNDQNIALDVPQLRWLFLATPNTNLPLAGIKRLEENIDGTPEEPVKFEEEFEECYLNAYRSIDKNSSIPPGMLQPFAKRCLDDNRQRATPLSARKALAVYISELLKYTPPPDPNNG